MKRTQIAALGVSTLAVTALFAWGAVAGAEEVMGIVAAPGAAQVAVNDQVGATKAVTISKVVAPRDAFVVVHQDLGGMPGKRLGVARVKAGTSRDVKVKLDPNVALTPSLLAAVHADGGKRGKFEFDMANIEHSPDRPFFVDGKEMAVAFKVATFGVSAQMGEAVIEAADQPAGASVTISRVVAPADSFVVVHQAKPDGMPGKRLGYAAVKAGDNTNVKVELKQPLKGKTKLLAAIHADRGVAGELEFDMDKPVASPDQPYMVDGMEAATAFNVGPFGVKVDKASVEAVDQLGATGSIVVARVVAPTDAWIVVHKDAGGGTPGARVGLKHVKAGESTDVTVKLDSDMLSENLLIALHADRGAPDQFDFDMADKLGSADQPFFVNGAECATAIKVREFGVKDASAVAAISASAQQVRNATVTIDRASAPVASWIVVHLDAGGGMPGKRVGLAYIPAGESRDVKVQLDASVPLTDTLLAAVHADRGQSGVFEFNMMDRVNSPDQPFFVNGTEVATPVSLVK